MRKVKAAVMFANAGIGETFACRADVEVVVAIEYDPIRADFYKSRFPDCHVIAGDVTDKNAMAEFIKKCKENGVELLLASPPCQGHSLANQSENKDDDIRNRLILNVIETVKAYPFTSVLIENVPSFLNYKSDTILPEFKGLTVGQYLENFFKDEGFSININQKVNAREYSETPQQRVRAIVLASKIGEWKLPPKLSEKKMKTIKDAIGDLPDLESGEYAVLKYIDDPKWRGKLHMLRYHNAPYWSKKDIEIMKHTPTGKSAFNNKSPYRPTRKDGSDREFYRSSYRRPDWKGAFPCVLIDSDSMGGMVTCHPGRDNGDGTYSNARAYTVLELLRSYGLDHNFFIPEWASDNDTLLRTVLGEAFAPLLVENLLKMMPR